MTGVQTCALPIWQVLRRADGDASPIVGDELVAVADDVRRLAVEHDPPRLHGGSMRAVAEPRGFLPPRSPEGRASIVAGPPWHYSGDLLTIEYRTDPAAVAELLPDPIRPSSEDPGAVAVIFADWQSCSDSFGELEDPVRSQYKECFVVVRCEYGGERYSRCVYIWVDRKSTRLNSSHMSESRMPSSA